MFIILHPSLSFIKPLKPSHKNIDRDVNKCISTIGNLLFINSCVSCSSLMPCPILIKYFIYCKGATDEALWALVGACGRTKSSGSLLFLALPVPAFDLRG